MKLNKKTGQLICTLERKIGEECYNPNSYDGWNDIYGCSYRYPVYVNSSDGSEYKTKWIAEVDKADLVKSLKYKFGSNHLFIGRGIIKVLEYLEERYDLDFNELEKNVKKK